MKIIKNILAGTITIIIEDRSFTITIGEWSRLIALPDKV
jgi:hypothetical protein